jgi:hypothetical protein
MTTITLDVPDELADQLALVRDRLPELLALSLRQPALPAHIYRYVLNFLASNPTPEHIAAFRPTPEMQTRLQTLLDRSRSGEISEAEESELDEFERIEHLVVLIKTGTLSSLTPAL